MPSWYLRQKGFSGPVSVQFLLDKLTAVPLAAFSTRKLRAGYTGKALNVTTSAAGNATQDIGFNGSGDLDAGALSLFIGSNTGSVAIWYDQSGNVANFTQATVGSQPVIVSTGALVTQNGHVWLQAISANHTDLSVTPIGKLSFAQPATIALLFKYSTVATSNSVLQSDVSFFQSSGTPHTHVLANFTSFDTGISADTAVHTGITVFNGASSQLILDGAASGTGNSGTAGVTDFELWQSTGDGFVGEVLVFGSLLSAGDKATIRSSWQSYWGAP